MPRWTPRFVDAVARWHWRKFGNQFAVHDGLPSPANGCLHIYRPEDHAWLEYPAIPSQLIDPVLGLLRGTEILWIATDGQDSLNHSRRLAEQEP